MIYCFDIDGTICNDTKGKYAEAISIPERIDRINQLHYEGNIIIFFTARGGTTGINWSELTKQQLKKWGAKYHKLIFGKPDADVFIDDKSITDDNFFRGIW